MLAAASVAWLEELFWPRASIMMHRWDEKRMHVSAPHLGHGVLQPSDGLRGRLPLVKRRPRRPPCAPPSRCMQLHVPPAPLQRRLCDIKEPRHSAAWSERREPRAPRRACRRGRWAVEVPVCCGRQSRLQQRGRVLRVQSQGDTGTVSWFVGINGVVPVCRLAQPGGVQVADSPPVQRHRLWLPPCLHRRNQSLQTDAPSTMHATVPPPVSPGRVLYDDARCAWTNTRSQVSESAHATLHVLSV